IGFGGLIKNWAFVFLGNLIGASLVALFVILSGVMDTNIQTVIATAEAKVSMDFFEAMFRGILCNFLVCIAVWMAFAAKTVTGKIAAVFFPVMLFVLCGFEHSVANMYYVPAGIFSKLLGFGGGEGLTVANMWLNNLIPVTIGNIIGGAFFVSGAYYLSFAKGKLSKK
ncbi:formate/nitrite transporter family protein, partial [Candidatus Saccharibacteria bacterium]|nr:formate/nitrite transporter family protein [Candidatus Saccharibacteria bacterium]